MNPKLIFCCLFILLVFTGCRSCRILGRKEWVTSDNRLPAYDTTKGLILTPKLNENKQTVIKFLQEQNLIPTPLPPDWIEYCEECDSTLFVIKDLTLPKLKAHANSGELKPPPASPPSQSGASGEYGPFIYSVNYIVYTPEPGDTTPTIIRPGVVTIPTAQGNPVLVGILDTGLDIDIAQMFQPQPITTCNEQARFGWNFVKGNNQFSDDFGKDFLNKPSLHGTPVAKFIIRQQISSKSSPLKILPVKILDSNGQADLFHVMCGMAYAKKGGVKIINASFGFYAPYSDQVKLFENFVKSITDEGIIIVAAAGNANSVEDKLALDNKMPKGDLRDIDKHLFYPAAFSDNNPNIITATTVIPKLKFLDGDKKLTVVDRQNFSSTNKVQVGIFADAGSYLLEPYPPVGANSNSRDGSSFATPVVTGLIAAHYNEIKTAAGNKLIDRDFILDWLRKAGLLTLKKELNTTGNAPAYVTESFKTPITPN